MDLIIKDRVKETTTTEGTGTITLAGASTGFRSFADIGNANTTYYCISGGSQFEVGLGTYTASGTTLSRDTVLSNSLGTTALINFSAGTKDVFCTYPSDKALLGSTSSVSSTGTGSVVLNSNPVFATDITVNGLTVGRGSGNNNTNTVIGNNSLSSITGGGTSNIVIGKNNFTLTDGTPDNNIVIGNNINVNYATGNIYIGANATPSYSDPIREIVIGNTTGVGDYSMVLGNSDTEYTFIKGSVSVNVGNLVATGLANTGQIAILGNATSNQSIATSQTSGTLSIGGASATGAITLGRSTGAQNINISNGAASTSIVNIGGTGASTGNINIGRSTGTQTISIGSGATGSTVTTGGTRTINIGTTSVSSGISNVNIGKYSSSVNHATSISGRTVNLTAETLTLNNFGALSIGSNLAQTTMFVADLGSLTGVVKGSRSFVTDNSITPVFNAIATDGGGTGFATPIFYDGTNWRCG